MIGNGKNFMILDKFLKKIFREKRLNIDSVINKIYEQLDDEYEYPWIMDYLIEQDGQAVIFTDFGKLYRADYTVSGDDVKIDKITEVKIEYVPTTQSRVYVKRENNKVIIYGIAAANVINRNGEIDSAELFDQFEKQYEEGKFNATLRFYHVEEFDFGVVDYVARFDNVLLFSATVDQDSPFARQIDSVDFSDWGFSIGFYASDYEQESVGETKINVFKRGKLVEISLLKEKDAASYFTKAKINRGDLMGKSREELKSKMLEFIGEEDLVEELLDEASIRNREIQEKGLITRETEVMVDDALVETIAKKVVEMLTPDETEEETREAPEIQELRGAIEELRGMLQQIQRSQEEKVQEKIDALPEAQRKIMALHRPTQVKEETEEQEFDLTQTRTIVKERLESLKRKGR